MPKLRKMLGSATSPYILSLMRVMQSQSKVTLANWAMNYAEANILPIYEKHCLGDDRPRSAIIIARKWLSGEVKFNEVKDIILNSCHQAAREAEHIPAAQAAARAVGQAASTLHVPTHCLGIAFYGAAAIAYDKYGLNENAEFYDKIAAQAITEIQRDLQAVCIPDEFNKAKINWNCKF